MLSLKFEGTFCKSAGGGGNEEKSNEEALWLRHERLIGQIDTILCKEL